MTARVGAIVSIAALLALGACERKPERRPAAPVAPAATPPAVVEGYQHQAGLNLSGFYRPDREIQIGKWRLSELSFGEVDAFDKWEQAQGQASGTYAPILLVFGDVTSPKDFNELGQEIRANTRSVAPSAWRVGESEVAFVADDPELGRITFVGRPDVAALARAKAGGGAGAKVLSGRLTIGDIVVDGVGFSWIGPS